MLRPSSPRPHHRVQLGRRLELHRRHDVRVRVVRDAHLRMAQAFLDDLRMNTCGKEQRGRRVPQVVEADSGQIGRVEQKLGSRGIGFALAGRPGHCRGRHRVAEI